MPGNMFTTQILDIIIEASSREDLDNFHDIFIVMEYVEHDLKAILTKRRPKKFDEEHVISIIYNILCSINYLSSANVLHRDLKPANVLITNTCTIKICDLGLARTLPLPEEQMVDEKSSSTR